MFCPEAWPVLERPATKAFWDTVKQASKNLDKRDEAKAKLAKEKQACLKETQAFPFKPKKTRWEMESSLPIPLASALT
jgi:hypothetical protein